MDENLTACYVYNPVVGDTRAGVESGFRTQVETQGGIGNFDDKPQVGRGRVALAISRRCLRQNRDIRFRFAGFVVGDSHINRPLTLNKLVAEEGGQPGDEQNDGRHVWAILSHLQQYLPFDEFVAFGEEPYLQHGFALSARPSDGIRGRFGTIRHGFDDLRHGNFLGIRIR